MTNEDLLILPGDCIQQLYKIPSNSVDFAFCDLPYGYTECSWDTTINMGLFWPAIERIMKPKAAMAFTAQQPFLIDLIISNRDSYKYSIIWDKKFGSNYMQASRQPIRVHEEVLIFSTHKGMPNYYPIMSPRDKPIMKGGNRNKIDSAIPVRGNGMDKKVYTEKHPTSIVSFSVREDRGHHPTQKPVSLIEYLIKTFTLPGQTVVDPCMGSGSTAIACINTGRHFIGIEKYPKWIEVAKNRIGNHQLKII